MRLTKQTSRKPARRAGAGCGRRTDRLERRRVNGNGTVVVAMDDFWSDGGSPASQLFRGAQLGAARPRVFPRFPIARADRLPCQQTDAAIARPVREGALHQPILERM